LLIDGKTVWRAKADLEQLSAPTISLDGDTLTMTADDRTETFAIFENGVEVATVANLISFTIDGTQYTALSGMTWSEWVESEYNTGGFYVSYINGYHGCIANGEKGINNMGQLTLKSLHLNGRLIYELQDVSIRKDAAYTMVATPGHGGGSN
jgi:roadblock/LC7 domain-containing protein